MHAKDKHTDRHTYMYASWLCPPRHNYGMLYRALIIMEGPILENLWCHIYNGYQHTQSVPTSSRGVWQITTNQAELVLSTESDGSFLVREQSGKPVYDPSSSSINTHAISVV